MLHSPLPPSLLPTGPRDQPREPVLIRCRGRQSAGSWQSVTVRDLNAEGFRLVGLANPVRGGQFWVHLPDLQPIAARICWVRTYAVGCRFNVPLHETVVAQMLARHGRR